jgi:hypothetical protein
VHPETALAAVVLDLLGAVEAVGHEHVDVGFLQQLQAAVLDLVRQGFRGEELVAGVDEGDGEVWVDEFELGGHLDADGAWGSSVFLDLSWGRRSDLPPPTMTTPCLAAVAARMWSPASNRYCFLRRDWGTTGQTRLSPDAATK